MYIWIKAPAGVESYRLFFLWTVAHVLLFAAPTTLYADVGSADE